MKNQNLIVFILASIVLFGYIILDLIFNDDMWDSNITLTINMQENQFAGEEIMFEIFTYIIFLPPAIAFIAFMTMDCKLNVLLYGIVSIANMTANDLLKNIYHQPRPYMTNQGIIGLKCNADFDVSGFGSVDALPHMAPVVQPRPASPTTSALATLSMKRRTNVMDKKNFNKKKNMFIDETTRNSKAQRKNMIILKVIINSLLLISVFMTGLSRVYLGVHSFGQVVLGWVYGTYVLVMYIAVVHKPMKKFCIIFIKERHENPQSYRHVLPLSYISLLVLVSVLVLLLQLNIHVFINAEDLALWLPQIEICEGVAMNSLSQSSPKVLYNAIFQYSFVGAIITGMISGAYFIQGSYEEGLFVVSFQKIQRYQVFRRVSCFLGMFIVLLPLVFIKTQIVYVQAFIQILPLSLIGGILITYIYPWICYKLKIQIKGDIFYLKKDIDESLLVQQYNDELQISLKEQN